jgi:hypothetical protein
VVGLLGPSLIISSRALGLDECTADSLLSFGLERKEELISVIRPSECSVLAEDSDE